MIPDSPAPEPAADSAPKRRKQTDNVRGAWISFIGRIVAQIIGAVASVVLGLIVLDKYNNRNAGRSSSIRRGRPGTCATLYSSHI